ncbi:MAG: AAA family ATPase [Thermoanaerobaculia bacterium]|nr:AAA family ATPase [Thermoanaerobaculia bacterium]
MKFPYGLADFQALIRDGYVYVDRTAYIRTMEEMGRFQLLVRPRRFGKSLWLQTLAAWYDLRTAERHDQLFGHLEAGKSGPDSAHRYFVLIWNFSKIPTPASGLVKTVEEVGARLESYLNSTLEVFHIHYEEHLPAAFELGEHPIENLNRLLALLQRTPYRLCLLIDEYDNFANEIMMTDEGGYRRLVSADGPFKHVMKWVKAATEGEGLERLFITGVTPVALNDLTSGLNIVENVSQARELNGLCGFSEEELEGLLVGLARAQRERGEIPPPGDETLEMMRTWYNGYRFAPTADDKVYNPTLVLYFLKHLQREGRYPPQMLDKNLAADEAKLRFLADGTASGELLAETLQSGLPIEIDYVEDGFHFADFATHGRQKRASLASFLYYFGMLTIEGATPWRTLRLAPPNLVVQRLYVEEMLSWILTEETGHPDLSTPARQLMRDGEIEPLLLLVEDKLLPRFSARDRRWMNELAVKTAFLTLLFQDVNYRLFSEPVVRFPSPDEEGDEPGAPRHGFADLVLLLRPDARTTGLFDLLLEFKYLKPEILGENAGRLALLSRTELAPASRPLGPRSPRLPSRRGATTAGSKNVLAPCCACARGRWSPSGSSAWSRAK